jgi:hypothetical protein
MAAAKALTRRFRFSLRALLLAVTVAGFVFAWVHRARQQQVAVESLRASNPNARVLYDRPGGAQPNEEAPWKAWVHKRLGTDYVATVAGVELSYPTDADLQRVAQLPHVRLIHLQRAIDVTDAGLAQLARLKHLRTLTINDAEQLTDAGLRQLAQLSSLGYLQIDLGRRKIGRDVIESLRRALPNCRVELGGASDREGHIATQSRGGSSVLQG